MEMLQPFRRGLAQHTAGILCVNTLPQAQRTRQVFLIPPHIVHIVHTSTQCVHPCAC